MYVSSAKISFADDTQTYRFCHLADTQTRSTRSIGCVQQLHNCHRERR